MDWKKVLQPETQKIVLSVVLIVLYLAVAAYTVSPFFCVRGLGPPCSSPNTLQATLMPMIEISFLPWEIVGSIAVLFYLVVFYTIACLITEKVRKK